MNIAKLAAAACAFACVAVHAEAASPQQSCNGTFSNGAKIDVRKAAYMADVGYIDSSTPLIGVNAQTECDVHSFAWNQFLYLTQTAKGAGTPRFMGLAPWYNVLTLGQAPGQYPGGSTDLK